MQAHWGTLTNPKKPTVQSQWDHSVAQAVASIMDEGVMAGVDRENSDLRPKLVDQKSGRTLLVDSGASRSIWPRSDFPEMPPDSFKALKKGNFADRSLF